MTDWIPVNKRLPEEEKDVLVASKCFYGLAYRIGNTWWASNTDQQLCGRSEPLFWYPVPAPPKLESTATTKWAAKDQHGRWYLYTAKPEYDPDFDDWFVDMSEAIVSAEQVGWKPPKNMKDALPQDSLIKLES